MSTYYYTGIPDYFKNEFVAVRDAADNILNLVLVAEIVNSCHTAMQRRKPESFDIAIFSGDYHRALVNKPSGYFSMGFPFSIEDQGEGIALSLPQLGRCVDGELISLMRNSIATWKENRSFDAVPISLHDSFGIDWFDALSYADVFVSLMAEDHGYFRFDDDARNANGHVHPRFHFDFFFKNSTGVKIGCSELDPECFYALCDPTLDKRYVRHASR